MSKNSFQAHFINILTVFVLCLLFSTLSRAQNDIIVCTTIFYDFKEATKGNCGQRDAAIRLGKKLIDLYEGDGLNKEVIEFVRKKIITIEKEDLICRRNDRYNEDYKTKNWSDFFVISEEIITEKGDKPIALDVMLTLISVGYERTVIDNDDTYNNKTIYYANKAIQMIESGKTPELKVIKTNGKAELRYGVFDPFDSKDNALGWMYYITGYLSYYKLNKQNESIGYFYKATQFKGG